VVALFKAKRTCPRSWPPRETEHESAFDRERTLSVIFRASDCERIMVVKEVKRLNG